MKEKSRISKIIKKMIIVIATIMVVGIVVIIGIGNYFVDYAIARTGNGGDREVKNADLLEVVFIELNKRD